MTENQPVTKADVQQNVQQLLADNKQLKTQLLTAKKVIEEYKKASSEQKSLNDKLGQRVASIEMERRKDKIASILQGAYKDEEFNARVDSFAKSGLPIDEIKNIVSPLAEMLKAANEQAKTQELNAKAEELAVQKTKSASLQNKPASKVAIKNATVEEEVTEVPGWAIATNMRGVA